MRRTGLGLAAIWIASALGLFLPAQAGWERELSLLALSLFPWVFWSTLPLPAESVRPPAQLAPALALPLVALALALDRARGHAWGELAGTLAGATLLAAAFAWAAQRGAGAASSRRAHVALWFALVAGVPLLRATLEQAGAPLWGRVPGWLDLLARISPLEWCAARRFPETAGLPWPALALALGFALAAPRLAGERRA